MNEKDFSLKEVVIELRKEIYEMKTIMANLEGTVDRLAIAEKENTTFRNKAINAIVGSTFIALAAVGLAVLKITGIIRIQ